MLAALVAYRLRAVAPFPDARVGRPNSGPATSADRPRVEELPPALETPSVAGVGTEDPPLDPDRDPPGHTESAPPPAPLRFLLVTQNADGSWGELDEHFEGARYSRHSATALALLAFLGHDVTHLSKETLIVEGSVKCPGEAVKSGLKWMRENPCDGGAFDTAITALAWGSFYGRTESKLFRPFVDQGYARLWELQDEAGSWGAEPRTSLWAAAALAVADLCKLEVPESAKSRATAWFARRFEADPSSPQDAAAAVMLARTRDEAGEARAIEALRAWLPSPSRPDAGFWFLGTLAIQRLDPWDGPLAAPWRNGADEALAGSRDFDSLRSRNGTGTASVVKVALGQMILDEVWSSNRFLREAVGK
ncbi:MAG: hypothetical protein IT452_16410 [Planctomycetia bacterium]|nr:hypothetical protein [Planctomycetia bacterium]